MSGIRPNTQFRGSHTDQTSDTSRVAAEHSGVRGWRFLSAMGRSEPEPEYGRRRAATDGFTLVEVVVSIAIIVTLSVAMAAFFVRATATSRDQGMRQAASRIATDGM